MNALNKKQQIFCHEYLKDFNATQAAIRAGYSAKSAYSQAHDLLKKPEISEIIQTLSKTLYKTIGLDTKRIISEIVSIAFSIEASSGERLKALETLLKYEQGKPKNESNGLQEHAGRITDAIQRIIAQRDRT